MNSKLINKKEDGIAILSLGIISLAALALASRFFFPLKKVAHWDEIVRYIYPGIKQFHFTAGEILHAVSDPPDNGQFIVFILRLLRNVFPNNHETAILAYKWLIFFVTVLVIYWFTRSLFKSFGTALLTVIFFLVAPMTWIQANEVMVEPVAFFLSLIWIGLSARLLEWRTLSRSGKTVLGLKLTLCVILFLLISYQFFLQVLLMTLFSSVLIILSRPSVFSSAKSHICDFVKISAAVFLVAMVIWFLLHWDHPVLMNIYFFVKPLGASLQNLEYSALHMSAFERFSFGLRNFAWLYFPAWFFLLPCLWCLLRGYPAFPVKVQFVVLAVLIGLLLSGMAFKGNLQPRYYHLTNGLFLIVLIAGMSFIFKAQWNKWNKRFWVTISLGLAGLVYMVVDYVPLFRVLPSLANMQAYGIYDLDLANSDESRFLFGALKRHNVISFPSLRYTYYYPYRVAGKPIVHVSKILEKVQSVFEPGVTPIALEEIVFYNQKVMSLQYLEKFGDYPPSNETGRKVLYISLSFPEGSPYHTIYYRDYGGRSEEKSEARWHERVASHSHEILLEEKNPQYTLRIARADWRSPKGEELDWNQWDAVKKWALKKVTGEPGNHTDGRLGWKSGFIKWVIERF